MRRLVSSILLLMALCSCSHKDGSESLGDVPISDITINANGRTALMDTTEYSIIRVTPLLVKSKTFLGNVSKLMWYNGDILLFDKDVSKSVFAFDSLGNIKALIGRKGHATNEFLQGPSDIAINKENGKLYLFEAESKKILHYDSEYRLKGVTRIEKFWPYSFSVLSDGSYAFAFRMLDDESESENCELITCDTLMNVKHRWRYMNEYKMFTKDFPFWSTDSNVHFIPNLSDTIFTFSADSIGHLTPLLSTKIH